MTASLEQSPQPQSPRHLSPNPKELSPYQNLSLQLKHLRLSHMLSHWETIEQQAMRENWSYAQFLLALCQLETQRRKALRLQRALTEAQLPNAKTVSNFDWSHLPQVNPLPIQKLTTETEWIEQASNILIFGPSGVGKTHVAAGLTRAAIEAGKRAKFFSATTLVQQLQQDKLHLQLQAALKKLDRFDLIVIDDLGYVQKSEAETSVLFELIAYRYERKSIMVTANQPFSQWESIFGDSMMTVAAIDRLIHHAVIFEMKADSFRKRQAQQRSKALQANSPETTKTSLKKAK